MRSVVVLNQFLDIPKYMGDNMRKILFLIAVIASPIAFAQGPGWTVASDVVRVVVTAHGGVNVRLSPELQGCTSQSGYGVRYASVYPDHPGVDKIYSALLAAHMSKEKVAIYLLDSTCKVGEIVVGGGI